MPKEFFLYALFGGHFCFSCFSSKNPTELHRPAVSIMTIKNLFYEQNSFLFIRMQALLHCASTRYKYHFDSSYLVFSISVMQR